MTNTELYLAFDIGGTTIKYSLITQDMTLLTHDVYPTPKTILESISEICEELIKVHHITAIGISTAGIVDSERGSIRYASDLIPNYIGTPLKEHLEKKFSLPVNVINDVQAALLGEALQNTLPDKTFCLTLGTGIGGAYFINDQLYHGANDFENSIGYLNFDSTTGKTWEQRASTIALEKKLKEKYDITVPEAFELARQNNKEMIFELRQWINEIAKGISSIILLFDPSLILIGGGVSKQNDYIIPILEEELEVLLPPNFLKTSFSTPSSFNQNALLGALYPYFITKN